MPIVHFASELNRVPADARNIRFQAPGFNLNASDEEANRYGKRALGPYVIITWETHNGLCLREREANSYHDSDFYMLVWNAEAGKPEEICFATTRGWSYPSYASRVDATPETLAAYKVWQAERQIVLDAEAHRRRVMEKLARRAERIALARAIGEVNYTNLKKLESVVPGGMWGATVKLLTGKLRSAFRQSLKTQILNWYFNQRPAYPTPLSRKQWDYV